MKKNVYIISSLLLIIVMIISICLNNTIPEIIDEELAISIAWLLIEDKFEPYDALESYLKAERIGDNWHVGIDYKRMYYEKVPYDDDPDYEVIIRGRDGKIKSVKSIYGQTKKYTRNLVDEELAIKIARLLLEEEFAFENTNGISLSAQKKGINWYIRNDKEKTSSKIYLDMEIVISSNNGKIKSMRW